MDSLPIRELLQFGAFLVAFLGLWYRIRQDTKAEIRGSIDKVKETVNEMKAKAISREEHDKDIEKVQQQIRIFRDEVRDDIRSMNAALSQRLDFMIQRVIEMKNN